MADHTASVSCLDCDYHQSVSRDCVNDPTKLMNYYDTPDAGVGEADSLRYVGPRILSEVVCEFVPEDQRASVAVVDVAAGAGLVGQELSKRGFSVIDAVDGSKIILDKVQQKGIYRHMIQVFFRNGEKCHGLPDNGYDIVTSAGGFAPDHLPSSSLDDLIRICKPGGLIVILICMKWLSELGGIPWFLPVLDELDGRKPRCWRLLKREMYTDPISSQEFLIFVYRKTLPQS